MLHLPPQAATSALWLSSALQQAPRAGAGPAARAGTSGAGKPCKDFSLIITEHIQRFSVL